MRLIEFLKREWFLIGYTKWLIDSGYFTMMEVAELGVIAREVLRK